MNIYETAKYLRMSNLSVKRMIWRGDLKSTMRCHDKKGLACHWFHDISREELQRLLKSGDEPATDPFPFGAFSYLLDER